MAAPEAATTQEPVPILVPVQVPLLAMLWERVRVHELEDMQMQKVPVPVLTQAQVLARVSADMQASAVLTAWNKSFLPFSIAGLRWFYLVPT